MKTLLHVGCGSLNKSGLKGFDSVEWLEIRFDIDPSVYPDIEGTLTDMHAVASGSVDAVYSSHNIEHVFPHEVHTVLLEFHRVLKEDGIVVLTCPDLQSVCQAVVNDTLLETLYESPRDR
jgi:predicted SAM-dependent methyltransferase